MDKKHQEEIAQVAYELYEKRGGSHGCDFDDWVEAEKIVMARHSKARQGGAKAGVAKTGAGAKKGTAPAKSAASAVKRKTPKK